METEKEINQIKKELDNHEKRISKLEEKRLAEVPLFQGEIKGIEKLVQKTGIPKEKIREIFDLEENTLTVVKFAGKDDKEKIKNISLLVLLGYKYFFEKNELFSQEIRRNVAENGVPLDNFASVLNEIMPSLIRRKGKPKSPKTTYRLIVLGESKARELIKQLCEKD